MACGVWYAGNYAPAPTERVHTVHAWLQHTLMQRIVEGGLATSSSVQARIHANISDAMGAYEQCKCAPCTILLHSWRNCSI